MQDQSFRPYPASWADWLVSKWDQLGALFWLPYLGLWLTPALAEVAAKWADGSLTPGQILPLSILKASYIAWALLFFRYLRHAAQEALETIRPSLNLSEQSYLEFSYRLCNAPAGRTLGASLLGAGFGLVYWLEIMKPLHPFIFWNSSGPSLVVDLTVAALIWACLGALFYTALRQTQIIRRVYHRIEQIDLMLPQPLYALSNYTLVTALGGTLINYVWFAVVSLTVGQTSHGIVAVSVMLEAMIVVVFVLPLWEVHLLLLTEKRRLQSQLNERLRAASNDLHRSIDEGRLERLDPIQKALSSMQVQQAVLDRASTWPWQPETFRILSTAIAAPLLIWLMQRVMTRFLS